jgi:hypothetical protein
VNASPALVSAVSAADLDTSTIHDAWKGIAAVYIAAFKAGAAATVSISPIPTSSYK